MGWREYIAFDLDLSPIGNEKPLRLFNTNILMTDSAFYEIVYASQPSDDNDKETQLAPDGSVSPYYPGSSQLQSNLAENRAAERLLHGCAQYKHKPCDNCGLYAFADK